MGKKNRTLHLENQACQKGLEHTAACANKHSSDGCRSQRASPACPHPGPPRVKPTRVVTHREPQTSKEKASALPVPVTQLPGGRARGALACPRGTQPRWAAASFLPPLHTHSAPHNEAPAFCSCFSFSYKDSDLKLSKGTEKSRVSPTHLPPEHATILRSRAPC